jgi:HK97 gp10 family phage protein
MFKIKTTGFQDLIDRLSKAPDKIVKEVDGVFQDVAEKFVGRAKKDAPKDTGNAGLTGQISYRKEGELKYNIFSGSRYAGYLEFGTKRNFTPIPGFEKEAAEIKGLGGGGSAEEAIENIKAWVLRKGIRFQDATKYKSGKKKGQHRLLDPETTAYIIWHFININGIKPKPYFFKQVAIAEGQLEKDLKQIAEEIFD